MTNAESERMLKSIEKNGAASKGTTCLKRFLKGCRLTQRESILAKCADCMGHYADGRNDCEIPLCPLYPFMPYRKDKPERKKRP